MKIAKHDQMLIDQFFREAEQRDHICESVCPNWWHRLGEQAENGYIDTFSCKEHYCTDLKIIRPYTDSQLHNAMIKRCKSANSQSDDLPCSHYEDVVRE